jgi:hypothetical protein
VSDEAPAPETPEPGGDLWWLALLFRVLTHGVGVFLVARFLGWCLGALSLLPALGAYALGVTFLLPVTAVAYPLVSGEWWLLPALIVPWLASVLLGMPLLDSPKQLGVWPLLGTILGIFMLISQAAERLAS